MQNGNNGCLIVCLGTPRSPEPKEIKFFLRRFLSDPAVVDFPRWLWKPILHTFVLPLRPSRIAPHYRAVWFAQGSPLDVYSRRQCAALSRELPDTEVRYATTYMSPSVGEQLSAMRARKITVIPLFPHYAPSTVDAIEKQVALFARRHPDVRVHIVPSWARQETLAQWYAEKIKNVLRAGRVEKIVFSYHGVPLRAPHRPGEYLRQCVATTDLIMGRVGDFPHEITFQSKFGPGKWLSPATVVRMGELPAEGVKRVLVLSAGFFADCIETLDELDVLNRETFIRAGGEEMIRLRPPNDDPVAGKILAEIYRRAQ